MPNLSHPALSPPLDDNTLPRQIDLLFVSIDLTALSKVSCELNHTLDALFSCLVLFSILESLLIIYMH